MRLITYRAHPADRARLGVLAGETVLDVGRLGAAAGIPLADDMLVFIDQGPAALAALAKLVGEAERALPVSAALPIENVKVLAPIQRPRKNIFGIGLNYVEHVAESSRALDTSKELPKQPVIFSKPPRP